MGGVSSLSAATAEEHRQAALADPAAGAPACVRGGDGGRFEHRRDDGAAASLMTVGVTWGFRDRQNLIDAGVRYLLDRPQQPLQLL